jgi:hypothetical protein
MRRQIPVRSPDQIEVVLGGGGIKGFGHIGLLKAVQERGINVGVVTGISIGSAVAAFYTNGYAPDDIAEIFLKEVRRLKPRSLGLRVRLRNPAVNFFDINALFVDVTKKYKLKANNNLRILSYNPVRRKPVIFEGTDYDIATAIAASCSVPGVMRPVWFGQQDTVGKIITVIRSWRGKTDEGILVDGGLHHPHPSEFTTSAAIISKLGFASELPSDWLDPIDLVFHLLEQGSARVLNWYYPDPDDGKHIIVPVGMPDVACLSFGLPKKKCLRMVDFGHQQALTILEPAILDGRIPLIK